MRIWIALAVMIELGAVATASAQSLADVARQEQARRKAITSSGKTYTNESLKGDDSAPAAPAAAAAATPAAAASDAEKAKKDDSQAAQDTKNDEATWRKRIAAERDALDRSKTFADALQSRINALSTDFAARDDPYQRQQIGTDRQKALAELDRVKQEIDQHTKAIADIQDEARKAGVPPGWVR